MKFFAATLKIATIVALVSIHLQPAQAQQQPDGGATAGATAGTTAGAIGAGTGSATLSTEVDTSAFGEIERGESVGDTGVGVFGLGDENSGGTSRTGVGGIGGGGLGAFGGLGGLSNLFGGFGAGAQGSAKPIIRTRIRSAVGVAPVAPALVQREVSMRLNQMPVGERQLRGVNVQMAGRTAVLTGTVGNESDRRMSELMLRLEPGVSNVENRVIVLP